MTAPAITLVELLRNTTNDVGTSSAFDITNEFLASVTPTTGTGTITYTGASVTRTGLSPGTTYWYWLSITDQAGLNAVQALGSITTAAPAPSPDITAAVDFQGGTDYLVGTGSTILDSKTGLVSVWIKRTATGTEYVFSSIGGAGTVGGIQFWFNNDSATIQGRRIGTTTNVFVGVGGNNKITDTNWHHFLFSWDMANSKLDMCIDGTVIVPTLNSKNNYFVRWDESYMTVGLTSAIGLNGCYSELYMATEYLDLSVEANRRKFISATGAPVSLGADGSTPTGTQPVVYLSGQAANWNAGKNFGSWSDFTVTGAVTDCTSSPGISSQLSAVVTAGTAPYEGSLSALTNINNTVFVRWWSGTTITFTYTGAPVTVTGFRYNTSDPCSVGVIVKFYNSGDSVVYTQNMWELGAQNGIVSVSGLNVADVTKGTVTFSVNTGTCNASWWTYFVTDGF